jgi:hypothetical protein
MVTPRTGKPRGAPPVMWCNDPDRYAVALIAALDAFEATSLRQLSLLMSGLMMGELTKEFPPGMSCPGKIGIAIEKVFGPGESTATFKGRAAALRKKYRVAAADPEAARWLIVMGGIFMLLIAAKDWAKVLAESARRAAVIGEEAFVHDLLLAIATSNKTEGNFSATSNLPD